MAIFRGACLVRKDRSTRGEHPGALDSSNYELSTSHCVPSDIGSTFSETTATIVPDIWQDTYLSTISLGFFLRAAQLGLHT